MIRYDLDPAELLANIKKEDANWFTKATARTAALIAAGEFIETAAIWSKAKPAFMILQKNKCIFCERLFSRPDESRIDMDLEHFRPKSAVKEWKTATSTPDQHGVASANGYYWLACNTDNYAASCKTCNSEYKGTFFPISGPRCTAPGNSADLVNEQEILVYPIGTAHPNPESLITFTGTVARPVDTSGPGHDRAELVIAFFGLNDRDMLHVERAQMIERFGAALIAVANGSTDPTDLTYVANIDSPLLPHAACVRAFNRLWQSSQADARRLYDACRAMLANRLIDPAATGLAVGTV